MHYDDAAIPPDPPPFSANASLLGATERFRAETESLSALVSGVLVDLQDLVRAEIALARAEMTEDAREAGNGAGAIAAGAVIGAISCIFLGLAGTWALALVLPLWASALVVAAILAAIGASLANWGRNTLATTSFAPTQTIETLKEDSEWAKRQIRSARR